MPFKVQPTTLSDMPQLVDIYFAAFSRNAFGSAVFPDAPAVRQWWIDTLSRELQHQRGVAMYNLVEYADGTDTPVFANNESRGQKLKNIVAFAKWLRPMEGADPAETAVEIPVEPPLPASCDQQLFTRYFAELNRRHKSCMGTKAHWCTENYFPFFASPQTITPFPATSPSRHRSSRTTSQQTSNSSPLIPRTNVVAPPPRSSTTCSAWSTTRPMPVMTPIWRLVRRAFRRIDD